MPEHRTPCRARPPVPGEGAPPAFCCPPAREGTGLALQPPALPRLFSSSFKTLLLFKHEQEGRGVASLSHASPSLGRTQDTWGAGVDPGSSSLPGLGGVVLVTYRQAHLQTECLRGSHRSGRRLSVRPRPEHTWPGPSPACPPWGQRGPPPRGAGTAVEAPFPGQAACLWVCGWETLLPGLPLGSPHGSRGGDPGGLAARACGCPERLCIIAGCGLAVAPTWPGITRVGVLGACTGVSATPRPPQMSPSPSKAIGGASPDSCASPRAEAEGPRPLRHTHVFLSRRDFPLASQHHTPLPQATRPLPGATPGKYDRRTGPCLASACSDETLYVFCMA
ncbi:uncharacterized protein LOC107195335 isoform X1 [Pteropus alecto]|uniref:uncharacterized protein LOC107195335 isoform X1 n=1 Tax=Pteropus alecto TaxID=9402 RepID=UPI00076880DF|nr:uncharacterized protein LOC107195335 isoform X1 [Pteropus alecto]